MLAKVEDNHFKSKLADVVYKYTQVFQTELSSQAALVQPYKIPLKPENDWMSEKNRHPPRWQTIQKAAEVEKFITKSLACGMI